MVVLDTNVIIYFLECHPEYYSLARDVIKKAVTNDGVFGCSVVTVTEVLRACQSETIVRKFFEQPQITILPILAQVAYTAGSLGRQFSLKAPDALILASAVEFSAGRIVTNDQRLQKLVHPTTNIESMESYI